MQVPEALSWGESVSRKTHALVVGELANLTSPSQVVVKVSRVGKSGNFNAMIRETSVDVSGISVARQHFEQPFSKHGELTHSVDNFLTSHYSKWRFQGAQTSHELGSTRFV